MRPHTSLHVILAAGVAVDAKVWVPNFKNLVTFGDSYTDENRLSYFLDNGVPPPTGTLLPPNNDTASGGVTWARIVSTDTGTKLYNYAVSGAVCDNKIINRCLDGIKGPFPDVVYEVDAFVADANFVNTTTNSNTLFTDRQSDNTVYSIWIGTNDLGVQGFLTDSSLNGTTIPDYVDCIFDKFDILYQNGARYFVLMNTAPLELSPLYGMPEAGGQAPSNTSEISGKMKEYTKLVNDIFNYRTPFEILVQKRYPDASIAVFDVNTLMTDIYYNPTQYFAAPANVTGQYELCEDGSGNHCVNSNGTLDQYFWHDELHPALLTDDAIAKEFAKVVEGTSVYAKYW
ncbi:hypothetical protein HYALB_00001152 [Hymenoscyphus albidus]|uniref:Carbohydrate esterase family 16 protein n=1 Tax=Hymenoscyphus albidus TaxID=595503 RepID=A0A9N9PRI0_9HELO|nr:hypothetical protein HYALB_00001152 [Hymenoscyphus albidus]